MAYQAAKDAGFKIGNATGGTVDISAYLTSASGPQMDAQTAETSTFGDSFKEYTRTQTDPGNIDVEGIHDPLIGTLLWNLGTAVLTPFEWYPQGSTTGKQKWSGTCHLTSYAGPGGGIDDVMTWSATFQVTGPVTIAVL